LTRIFAEWIRTIERANNAARDGEAEAHGIAEGQNELSGLQGGRISPRDAGQIAAVDLDHREIGEWIGADDLAVPYPLVTGSDADVHRAIDDVIVSDDVAVGRNYDAAANAMFDLRLLRTHARESELLSEELRHRILIIGVVAILSHSGIHSFGGNGNVKNGWSYVCSEVLHGFVECEQRADAAVFEGRSGRRRGGRTH